jgi:hypothetical protein
MNCRLNIIILVIYELFLMIKRVVSVFWSHFAFVCDVIVKQFQQNFKFQNNSLNIFDYLRITELP